MKKWHWILIGIGGFLVIVVLGLSFCGLRAKAKLSKRPLNLIDLPAAINYSQLAPNQLKELFRQAAKKYPSQIMPEGQKEEPVVVLQDILLAQNEKIIPSGQTIAGAETLIPASNFSQQTPKAETPAKEEPQTPTPQSPTTSPSRGGKDDKGEKPTTPPKDEEQPPKEKPPKEELPANAGTIFISRGNWGGNLGGLAGADQKCQEEAQKNNLSGNWKAILGTFMSPLRNRLADIPYKNVANKLIANDLLDLFDGSTANPILLPDGEAAYGGVWTGSDQLASGNSSANTCNDWVNTTGKTTLGYPDKTDSKWLAAEEVDCTRWLQLYCASSGEQPPQGPAVYYTGTYTTPQEQAQVIGELRKIKPIVERYYPKIVELYGQPYNASSRRIYFYYDPQMDFQYYPQYDIIVVNSSDPKWLAYGLISVFQGKYATKVPETWRYGMNYAVWELVTSQFPGEAVSPGSFGLTIRNDYEKFNQKYFPIWGATLNYGQDIFPYYDGLMYRINLATMAMLKPYFYDKQFYAKLNQKFYELPLEESFWGWENSVFSRTKSVFPTIEGDSPDEWYGKQHVLHQTETNPLYIMAMRDISQTFVVQPGTEEIRAYEFTSGTDNAGRTRFAPRPNISLELRVRDQQDKVIKSGNYSSGAYGKAVIRLQSLNLAQPARYMIQHWWWVARYHFDYFGFGIPVPSQLHGAVNNFGQGKIIAQDSSGKILEEATIANGAFQFNLPMQGVIKLVVKDYQDKEVFTKEVAKDLGSYFAFLDSPSSSFPPAESRGGSRGAPSAPAAQPCDQINTSSWQTYNEGWTIKYPTDWQYKKESTDQAGPIYWYVSFGPKDKNLIVSVGGFAQELQALKQTLTQQNYTIEKEETAKIGGINGSRLLTQGPDHYKFNFYYLPFGNVAYLIKGPAMESATEFDNCVAQIFQKMLETFKPSMAFGPLPPSGQVPPTEEGVHEAIYFDDKCKFSFAYPSDWEIKSNEYYETAGGSKATVPSIVLGKVGGASSGNNTISINMRQAGCMPESATKSQETADGKTFSLYQLIGQNSWCAEAQAEGLDINGKSTTYSFVTYFDEPSVKEVFKGVLKSFRITK